MPPPRTAAASKQQGREVSSKPEGQVRRGQDQRRKQEREEKGRKKVGAQEGGGSTCVATVRKQARGEVLWAAARTSWEGPETSGGCWGKIQAFLPSLLHSG
jgi:hypothetical protein